MRSLVIIALFFFVNSAFLRDLEAVSISGATLGTDCVESTATSVALSLTLTAGAQVTQKGSGFTVALSEGENKKITSTCTLGTDKVTFNCTGPLTSPAVGNYTLDFLTETPSAEGGEVNTFTIGDNVSVVLMVAKTVEIAETQETAQTVDLKDNNKKTFKIALHANATVTEVPAVFAGNDATTPLSACNLTDNSTVITCSPTKDEMEDGEKYKIYYNKGCTKSDSGIEVTFKNESVFMTVSKIALIAFALLF